MTTYMILSKRGSHPKTPQTTMSTSNNITTSFLGSRGGVSFDDTPAPGALRGSFISKIIIQHSTYIYSFKVVCSALRGGVTRSD